MKEVSKTAYFWLGFTFDPPPQKKKKKKKKKNMLTKHNVKHHDTAGSSVFTSREYLAADAEIKIPSPLRTENYQRPGVGQNSYSHTPFAYFQEFLPF